MDPASTSEPVFPGPLPVEEARARATALVADTLAELMRFWNFKPSMGRIWAVLYLSREPLDAEQIERASDLSAGMVGTVLRACKHVVQIGAADEAVARCRAALKAAVYLLSWLVQVAEKAHADKAAGAVANPTGKGKKRAGKAEAEIAFDWEAHREEAALRLQEVLDVSNRSRSPPPVAPRSSRPAVHPGP